MSLNLAAPTAPLDLSTPQRLHVVGVGGPGMSAVAIVLAHALRWLYRHRDYKLLTRLCGYQ